MSLSTSLFSPFFPRSSHTLLQYHYRHHHVKWIQGDLKSAHDLHEDNQPSYEGQGEFSPDLYSRFYLKFFFYEGVPFVHLKRAKQRAINWLAIWHFLKEWNYNSFWQGKQWRWLQSIPETNPFSSTSPSRPLTCQCRYLGQSLQEDSWSYPQEPPAVHLNKYRKTHRVYQKYLQEHPQQIYRAATITVREKHLFSNPWFLVVLNCTGFGLWCQQNCGRPEGKQLVRQLNNRLLHG